MIHGQKFFLDALNDIPKEVQMQVDMSMSLSDRVANLMKAQGLSKRDFSKKLGISESKLTNILSGTHNFTLSMIAKLSNALGEKLIVVKNEM